MKTRIKSIEIEASKFKLSCNEANLIDEELGPYEDIP